MEGLSSLLLEQKIRLTETQIIQQQGRVSQVDARLRNEQTLLGERRQTFNAVKAKLLHQPKQYDNIHLAHHQALKLQKSLRQEKKLSDIQTGKVKAATDEQQNEIKKLLKLKAQVSVLQEKVIQKKIERSDQKDEIESSQVLEMRSLQPPVHSSFSNLDTENRSALESRSALIVDCSATSSSNVSAEFERRIDGFNERFEVEETSLPTERADLSNLLRVAASAETNSIGAQNSREFSRHLPEELCRGLQEVQTRQGKFGPEIELQMHTSSGRNLALRFVPSEQGQLRIEVRSSDRGDRRVLWGEAEKIQSALKKAGINQTLVTIVNS